MIKLTTILTALLLTATSVVADFYKIPGADDWGFDKENYQEWETLHKTFDEDFNKNLEFIRTVGEEGVVYRIFINGAITQEMADKFEAYFYRINERGDYDFATQIYLNSQGGNASAGVRMARVMLASGAWSDASVTKGQECHSACVAIFNAAHFRSVEHNGILGIHAPYTGDYNCSDNKDVLEDMAEVVNPRVSKEAADRYIKVASETCGPTVHYTIDTFEQISGGEGA